MAHNFKALTVLVALAATGVYVSAASAADLFTTFSESKAIVTGTSGDNIFRITLGGGTVDVECSTAKFSATVVGTSSEATVSPTYAGTIGVTPHTSHCSSDLGSVTVDMNGCDYVVTGDTFGTDGGGADARVHVVCPKEKEIELTNSLCSIKIPSQTPTSGGVSYTNEVENGIGVVNIKATATGITYTTSGSFCALGGLPSEGNSADYLGSVVVTGFEDNESKEGSQVTIAVF